MSQQLVDKLQKFVALVEYQTNAKQLITYGSAVNHETVEFSKPGKRYVRIFFQSYWQGHREQRSSRYFVEVATGKIFACEGWKKPNLRRSFGTLDTIDQFDWSDYEGVAKLGSDFKMVKTSGMYFTAVKA